MTIKTKDAEITLTLTELMALPGIPPSALSTLFVMISHAAPQVKYER